MATIKEITTLCKAGQLKEALQQAQADLEATPDNVWAQRALAWALYYTMKADAEQHRRSDFLTHLKELTQLNQLSAEADEMIYSSVAWKAAEFVHDTRPEQYTELNDCFDLLQGCHFVSSKGYSFLLKAGIGQEAWERLAEFIEWWDLERLMPEDYQPFRMENGRQVMSLAEQAYIGYAKALLRLRDQEKIAAFIPRLERLMEQHPEMMYPGYFCGKLMLATGADEETALSALLPFVRMKQTEFWAWQLLSDVFSADRTKRLACLLRAVHCKTQESFLGKVRMRLVALYLELNDTARAKFHLDKLVACYMQSGWHLPYEAQSWVNSPWVQSAQADRSDGVDYKCITQAILAEGTNASPAVVTYVDVEHRRAAIIYGREQRTMVRLSDLRLRVQVGSLLNLHWMTTPDSRLSVVAVDELNVENLNGCDYVKRVSGIVTRRSGNPFAFLRGGELQVFVAPPLVQKHQLQDGDRVSAVVAYDYNKSKQQWSWSALSISK
jgi:tetratricopeptide (TPR) repeat protein